MPRPHDDPSHAPRAAQVALSRDLTPGERIERQAELCRQLAEVRRAGRAAASR